MSEFILGNVYEQSVRHTVQPKMPWVRGAEIITEVSKTSRGHKAVIPMTVLSEEIDDDTLDLNEESDELITNEDRDVEISLAIYGSKYQKYDSTGSLQETVADRALMSKIKRQARLAANTVDHLAASAVLEIPVDGTDYDHEMGPHDDDGAYFEPVGDGLIHIGNEPDSLDSADELAEDNKITAQILRVLVQEMQNRGVEPQGYLEAGNMDSFLYECIMTDKQMLDLRAEVGAETITSIAKYLSTDGKKISGVFQIWGNLILMSSLRGKEIVEPDEGDPFYAHRAVLYGRQYYGLATTPADDLPDNGSPIERIGVFGDLDAAEAATTGGSMKAYPRIFEIRKVPKGDAQGKISLISWYAHLGFKLTDPLRGIQLITRASNDPAIVLE